MEDRRSKMGFAFAQDPLPSSNFYLPTPIGLLPSFTR